MTSRWKAIQQVTPVLQSYSMLHVTGFFSLKKKINVPALISEAIVTLVLKGYNNLLNI